MNSFLKDKHKQNMYLTGLQKLVVNTKKTYILEVQWEKEPYLQM